MASIKIIRRLSEYLEAIRESQFVLGLHDSVAPSYTRQGTMMQSFHTSGDAEPEVVCALESITI